MNFSGGMGGYLRNVFDAFWPLSSRNNDNFSTVYLGNSEHKSLWFQAGYFPRAS